MTDGQTDTAQVQVLSCAFAAKNYVGEILRFYLEGKIHFENFLSLSFRPSQGHNSVNNGSNSASRDSFGKLRSRALIWHQD